MISAASRVFCAFLRSAFFGAITAKLIFAAPASLSSPAMKPKKRLSSPLAVPV